MLVQVTLGHPVVPKISAILIGLRLSRHEKAFRVTLLCILLMGTMQFFLRNDVGIVRLTLDGNAVQLNTK